MAISRYSKLGDESELLSCECREKIPKLSSLCDSWSTVNTANTLKTDHFEILKTKSQIRKYVKYAKYGPLWNLEAKISNTLNTGHFEMLLEKSEIRKYAKYGPL